ncbi:hypothetical protein NQ315_014704 [Exocentrus adspersus]|uniref:Uncharacterized protein n=1 Tax=Exocentrus adspersus TaxID=1586481 RepID=A0AAV8VE94_9CUCU|nr:hypothetical protein NQ315_014704 [Exocentrus adspersus]
MLLVQIGTSEFELCCLVVPQLVRPCIIGTDWLRAHHGTLDLGKHERILRTERGQALKIPFNTSPQTTQSCNIELEEGEIPIALYNTQLNTQDKLRTKLHNSGLIASERQQLEQLLMEFAEVSMAQKRTVFNEDWVNPIINREWADIFTQVRSDPFSAFL